MFWTLRKDQTVVRYVREWITEVPARMVFCQRFDPILRVAGNTESEWMLFHTVIMKVVVQSGNLVHISKDSNRLWMNCGTLDTGRKNRASGRVVTKAGM